MSDRKPSPSPVILNNDVCSMIQATEDVYQIRFKNRARTPIWCAEKREPS